MKSRPKTPRSAPSRQGRRSFTVADRGGHFPMLEVPDRYVRELRRALGAMPW